MKKIALLALTFTLVAPVLALPALAQADWTPRLRCGTDLIVDGEYSTDRGFTAYQLVIRHAGAVAHLETLTGRKLRNESGEILVPMRPEQFGGRFDGSMRAPLGMFPVTEGSPSKDIYELLGHWLDGGRYHVELTHVSYSPGSSYQAPQNLGDWVFTGCQTVR